MGDAIEVPAAPGNANQMSVPTRVFDDVKIVSVEFNNDHHMMKDNSSGWSNGGSLYAKPEFVAGKTSAPVSYTRNQYLGVTATFKIMPETAAAFKCRVTSSTPWMKGEWEATLKGGTCAMSFSWQLPDVFQTLRGDIEFMVDNGVDGPRIVGSSMGHVIHVTMDTPISLAHTDEEGVTERRLRAAMELVGAAASDDLRSIASSVMATVKQYTLTKDPSLSQFAHPRYRNASGGAWPIAQYADKSAECQAICRFARAVMAQVGCPGSYDVYVVWAEPTKDGGKTAVEAPIDGPCGLIAWNEANPHPQGWQARLADRPCVEGGVYAMDGTDPTYIGFNSFEACLRVGYIDSNNGAQKYVYYGGGIPGVVFKSAQEVLPAFYALCWVSHDGVNNRVEKVIARYQR